VVTLADSGRHRQVPRDDASLAVIGTHIRNLPPGWEVRPGSPPQIAHRRSGRICYSLEDAWSKDLERVKASPGATRQDGGKGRVALATGAMVPTNGNSTRQVSAEELAARLQDSERNRLDAEARVEDMQIKLHHLLVEISTLREERDGARIELAEARQEIERLQHGLAHRSASQTSLTSASQTILVSPIGLQPSSSAKCIKSEASGVPAVPNSWQPPQSAREAGKCLSPVSGDDGEDGDMFPGPDFSSSGFRSFQPLATTANVPAAAPPPRSEKPVEIIVSVPRATGPEDMIEERRGPPPSRSLQSLQNTQVAVPHIVTRLPSAPVNSQAFPPHAMQMQYGVRMMTSASASVPSAPASLAAPAGGVRVAQRPSLVPMPRPQACMHGYQAVR